MAKSVKVSAPQDAAASTALIVGMINKVRAGYSGVQSLAQEAGLAILVHAKKYGDCSKAPVLCRALPARERNSFIGWLGIYSPIRLRMGQFRGGKMGEDKSRMATADEQPSSKNRWGYKPFDIEAATEHPWWTDPAKANPIPGPLDTLGDFEKTIRSRLENAIEAAKKGERFIPTQKDNVVSFATFMLERMKEYDQMHEKTVPVSQPRASADKPAQQPRVAASA